MIHTYNNAFCYDTTNKSRFKQIMTTLISGNVSCVALNLSMRDNISIILSLLSFKNFYFIDKSY